MGVRSLVVARGNETTVDGRAATLTIENGQVTSVTVCLRDSEDEIDPEAVRAAIATTGQTSMINAHVAWIEGVVGDDGVWKGVARFYPLGWNPHVPRGTTSTQRARTVTRTPR